MKKYKGFMFAELIAVAGIFSIIIFPIIMLMNKNINHIIFLKKEYELCRVSENLENIFNSMKKRDEAITGRYFLIKKEDYFILKNSEKEITKLRDIKYLENMEIFLKKKKIFSKKGNIKTQIGEVNFLEIRHKDKIVRKILDEDF